MQLILSTVGPITFIVPDSAASPALSIALRLAHDLEVYHKLDATIVFSSEWNSSAYTVNNGNVVVIGDVKDNFITQTIQQSQTPVRLSENQLIVGNTMFDTRTSVGRSFLRGLPLSG
jgi:hypothetical protein